MLTYESLIEVARQKFLTTESINSNLRSDTPPEIIAYTLIHAAGDTIIEHVLTLADAMELIVTLDGEGILPTIGIGEFSDESWLEFFRGIIEETLHYGLSQQVDLFLIDEERSAKFND